MTENPYSSPKEDPTGISQKRDTARMGHRVARCSFVIYGVIFLGASLAMCSCPGFFACMAVCAIIALVAGSRIQRIVAFVLLLVAILGFAYEFQKEQEMSRRMKRLREAPAQR